MSFCLGTVYSAAHLCQQRGKSLIVRPWRCRRSCSKGQAPEKLSCRCKGFYHAAVAGEVFVNSFSQTCCSLPFASASRLSSRLSLLHSRSRFPCFHRRNDWTGRGTCRQDYRYLLDFPPAATRSARVMSSCCHCDHLISVFMVRINFRHTP